MRCDPRMTAPADDIRRTVDALMEQAISANEDVSTEQMMTRAVQAERDRCFKIADTYLAMGWRGSEPPTAIKNGTLAP